MGIIIKPVLTERMTILGDKLNRYGFIVDVKANKLQIRAAVEQMYNVVVTDVPLVGAGLAGGAGNGKGETGKGLDQAFDECGLARA